MKLAMIHHISLKTSDLEKAKRFYGEVLGLVEEDRPNFSFAGAWYRIGEYKQLHLIEDPGFIYNPGRHIDTRGNHVAFRVDSYQETAAHLKASEIEIKEKPNSTSGFAQIFCCDPDGHIIEFHVPQQ
ncbi:VOC family protein [Thalassobacillus devorans]|uniref:VOC family protein n=1 Tax=Thalassobacillus devorans TaxID=279813 RepID=UPI00048F1C84|nr:VOC family protein [Thalassobacillus devorans]